MLAATPLPARSRTGDEPVAVPRAIKQGIDFVYVDPQMRNVARRKQRPQNWLQRIFSSGAASRRGAPNPMFDQLARGLQQYQATWGRLPQTKIPAGAALKRGSTGKRVSCCAPGSACRPAAAMTSSCPRPCRPTSRSTASARPTASPGKATIASLNRGADLLCAADRDQHGARLPPARRPAPSIATSSVDSGAAEAYLFDRDRMADKMRVDRRLGRRPRRR